APGWSVGTIPISTRHGFAADRCGRPWSHPRSRSHSHPRVWGPTRQCEPECAFCGEEGPCPKLRTDRELNQLVPQGNLCSSVEFLSFGFRKEPPRSHGLAALEWLSPRSPPCNSHSAPLFFREMLTSRTAARNR